MLVNIFQKTGNALRTLQYAGVVVLISAFAQAGAGEVKKSYQAARWDPIHFQPGFGDIDPRD